MKIRKRELKNWIFHRIQVLTNLCFHWAKFGVNKHWFKQLLWRKKIFNLLKQNSFYNTFKQSMKDFSSQIHQQLMSVVAESHFYQWSLVCYSSFLQATTQVYPPKTEDPVQLTRLQERLLKKLGSNAYPFKFEVCFPLEILESNSLMFTIQ